MITYERASEKHVNDITSLFVESFSFLTRQSFHFKLSGNFAKEIVELYLDAGKEGFLIAREGAEIAGMICAIPSAWTLLKGVFSTKRFFPLYFFAPRTLFITPTTMRKGGHIITLAVKEKYQKKGIAMNLVTKALTYLKEKKVENVFFQIPHANQELVDKYVENGSEVIKEKGNFLLMKKVIQ